MPSFKELYIAEHERIVAELEEAGVASDKAHDMAGERAYDAARDRLADMADAARQRQKDRDL